MGQTHKKTMYTRQECRVDIFFYYLDGTIKKQIQPPFFFSALKIHQKIEANLNNSVQNESICNDRNESTCNKYKLHMGETTLSMTPINGVHFFH